MNSDIVDLALFLRFPARPAGRALADHGAVDVWAQMTDERLVGLGYALPWLDRYAAEAERT